MHFVPNGVITAVTNLSMDFSYALIDVSVAYKENLDQVEARMLEVAHGLQSDPHWVSRLKFIDSNPNAFEMLGLQTLGDSAVVLRCRFKTVEGEWATPQNAPPGPAGAAPV